METSQITNSSEGIKRIPLSPSERSHARVYREYGSTYRGMGKLMKRHPATL